MTQRSNPSSKEKLRIDQSIALVARLRAAKATVAKANEINVADTGDVQRWCETFGVSASELLRAIDRVGANASVVRRQLRLKSAGIQDG